MEGKPEAGDIMTSDKIVNAMREIWRLNRSSSQWYHNGPVVSGIVHNVVTVYYTDRHVDENYYPAPSSEWDAYVECYLVKRNAGSGDIVSVTHIPQTIMENLYGYIVDELPVEDSELLTAAQVVQTGYQLHCLCDGSALYLTYLRTTTNPSGVAHFKIMRLSLDGEYQDTIDVLATLHFPPLSIPDNWWSRDYREGVESDVATFVVAGWGEHIWLSDGWFYTYASSVISTTMLDKDPNAGGYRGAIVKFSTSGSDLQFVEYEYDVLVDGDGDGEYFGRYDYYIHYSIGHLGQASDGTMIMRRLYAWKEPSGDSYEIKKATAYGPMSMARQGAIFETYSEFVSAVSDAWYIAKRGDIGFVEGDWNILYGANKQFTGGNNTLWFLIENTDRETYAVFNREVGATLQYTMNADSLQLFDSPYGPADGTPTLLVGQNVSTSEIITGSPPPVNRGPNIRQSTVFPWGEPVLQYNSSVPPDPYATPESYDTLWTATLYDMGGGGVYSVMDYFPHSPPFSESQARRAYRGVFETTINDTVVDSGETISGNVIIAHVLTRGDGTLLVPVSGSPLYVWPEDDFHVYRVFFDPADGSILGYIHAGASKIYPFKAYRSNGDSVPIWQGLLDNGGTLDEMETPSYALTWEHSQDAPSGDYPDVAFRDGSNMVVKLITDMRAALHSTVIGNYIILDPGPPITMRLVSPDEPVFAWAKTEQQLIDQGYCSVDEIGEIYDAINETASLIKGEGGILIP